MKLPDLNLLLYAIDEEAPRHEPARGCRVDAALQSLREAGVRAEGRADIAEPMESLLDGLREFPANEIVMLPGREGGWDAAGALAERVRSEAGLPVTEVSHAS